MAAALLNITLAVGDVRFHLAPAPPGGTGDADAQTPSPRSRLGTLSSHRRRQPRRRGRLDGASLDRQGSAPHQASAPIVSIRHGGSATAGSTSSINALQRGPSSPQSPLQRHILGRVRAMKDRIEPPDGTSGGSARAASQSPLFSSGNAGGGEYCVDLSSFTGTLRITSAANQTDTRHSHQMGSPFLDRGRPLQNENTSPYRDTSPWQEKCKTITSPRHAKADRMSLSKKRARKSFGSWMPPHSPHSKGFELGVDGSVLNDDDRHASGCSESKKSVRFSMLQSTDIVNSLPSNGGSGRSIVDASPNGGENNHPNNANNASQSLLQSPGHPPKKRKSGYFFASPPTTFPSPPRAAVASLARETSSMVKKSGKHILRQITLAGKDAYDVLNGDAAVPFSDTAGGAIDPATPRSNDAGASNHFVYDAFDGTELHYACASDTLDDLRVLLEHDGAARDLFKPDCEGRLPIHVLTENFSLIDADPIGCEEAVMEMIELMGPEKAIQALHLSGLAPFVHVIGKWTEQLHRGALLASSASMAGRGLASKRLVASGAATAVEDTRGSAVATSSNSPPRRSRVAYRSLFNSSSNSESKPSISSVDRCKLLYLPPSVVVSDHVRWAIGILSRLIDEYPEQTRESILTNIASVPLFVKSLLLIQDDMEVMELLSTSLVKHVVMDKRSINVWLCAMLTADSREVKMRAVTFMRLLSSLTLQDLAGKSASPDRYSEKEVERFATLRDGTFNAVYVIPGIIPAVLELGGHTIEKLSTTAVMKYLTDRTIRKENVFFVLITDFFYSIFLLMGYRLNVEFVLAYQNLDGPEVYNERSYISTSTLGMAGYFLLKEALTLLSLYLTSRKLAKRYCLSVFKIIDVAAVALLVFSEALLTVDPSFFLDNDGYAASLTIVLLWLKLMGAFKILNAAFSLFLYAVNEVIKEVRWFLLFLMMVVFMFADAARTVVAARGDCQVISEDDYITQEFCSDNLLSVVTRMYSVLVGDVALEYFQSSDALVTVFVFFSFFSIIILLNILIAIIIDSYDSSKQRSREIFYRARIEYAAHLVARKQFLSPRQRSDFHVATYVPQKVRLALRFVYMLVSALAFLSFQYGFFGAVYFMTLENKQDFRMIRALVIIYISVGSVFNAYILSVVTIASWAKYDKQYNRLHWLTDDRPSTARRMTKKGVRFLEVAVKGFHRILGFNADKTVDHETNDLAEKQLGGSW
ncbi:hypothetical protein ACHAXT_010616 [Thalassiosira profunda]